jgi:ABC-type transport system involved in multi-copper enzyme maturation permease subunit
MKKYLAIIQDSFREAFASRVMWLVLIGITFLLVLLAPFGFREVLTTRFRDNDLRRPDDFLVNLRTQGPVERPSPTHRIWLQLTDKTRRQLAEVSIPGKDDGPGNPFMYVSLLGTIAKEVDAMLQRADFYDADSWKGVQIASEEARDLLKRRNGVGKDVQPLSPLESARFNRLLLEAAFPEEIRISPPTSVQFTYAWMNALSPQPLRGSTVRESLSGLVATVMGFFVGAIGVFVAILVTAPIIPQMFDAGSLHLLLSKPISRWKLFLAKYLGGCAFILIAATYLIAGLWLILGIRFGFWEPKLLWSIPIYLFVFAVYYSVSSLAGVIWRSAVVSIAVSIFFWLMCFVVGLAKTGYENVLLNKERFIRVFYAKETLFAVDEFGWGKEWDSAKREWRDQFVLAEQRQSRPFLSFAPAVPREFRTIGPIYDPTTDRIYAAIPAFPPTKTHFAVATRSDNWEPSSPVTAPLGTMDLLGEPSGKVLVVSSLGLSRLTGDPLAKREPIKIGSWAIPLPGGGPFQMVNPDPPVLMTQPADAAIHSQTGELALFSRSTLTILAPNKNRFQKRVEHKLDGKERQAAVVCFAGSYLLVGREDGRVQIFDHDSLKLVKEWNPEGVNPPRFVDASPDGKWFAIVFHTGRLWLLDANKNELFRANVSGQGAISAANFTATGRLLVADRTDRVSEYSLEPLKLQQRFSPNSGLLLNGYRYILVPLYTIFPKPGELDKTFDYLISGKETEKTEGDADLTSAQRAIDPWTPLWSSAVFTLIVLAAACAYIEWQEF